MSKTVDKRIAEAIEIIRARSTFLGQRDYENEGSTEIAECVSEGLDAMADALEELRDVAKRLDALEGSAVVDPEPS
jgi:hypothetical protein